MNILILGNGGREHAIAEAVAKSPHCDKLFAAPGNGGIDALADESLPGLNISSAEDVAKFAKDHNVDLVVIGPEAPLVDGVADGLRDAGITVFGPDSQGAQLEGSKTFCKDFISKYDIPTAKYQVFTDYDSASAYVHEQGIPLVIKADGLAGGKGVVVAETLEQADEALHSCFEGAFGGAGERVVIEELLHGPECSLLAFVSNGKAICMPTAQDHKRAYVHDEGPNTGGMGAYSPVPIVTDEELATMKEIMERIAAATATEFDHDYRGVLYGAFMLTSEGPKVLEFNVRFGDPETQVILPRLESDLVDAMLAVAEGRPDDIDLKWSDKWAVCVVLVSDGYPGPYSKGMVIAGIDDAEKMDGITVYQAGTALDGDNLVTDGGRVVDIVALADTFDDARQLVYQAVDRVEFKGKHFRGDIGKKAAAGRTAWEIH